MFLIYKSDTVNELPVHDFIFQHNRQYCPNIYKVLESASVSLSHRSLPSALWTTSWLLLAPHHRRRTFSQQDVSLGVETSHNGVQKLISFLCMVHEKLQHRTHLFRFVIVNILGTQHAYNFLYPSFSVTSSWIVVLDTLGMMWCNSLIVTCRFAWISPSFSWRRSSEIKDGVPLLCSSWTSVLPSENSQHHFVTFCRFITLP